MEMRTVDAWALLAAAAALAGACDSAELGVCGRGSHLQVDGERFCVLSPDRGDPRAYDCPAQLPFRVVVAGGGLVCAERELRADDLPPAICASAGAAQCSGADATPVDGSVDEGLLDLGIFDAGAPDALVADMAATDATPVDAGMTCPEGMLLVPAATFLMGSPAGAGDEDERPAHEVRLPAYCLDRTEVTVADYESCVATGACTPLAPGLDCNAGVAGRADHPVNCVDWNQAVAYCDSRDCRLPSEAEWEHAARGEALRPYPWGDEPPDGRLNACAAECPTSTDLLWDDGHRTTAPVASFTLGAGPYGHVDLAGNVWEWVADAYAAYPGGSIPTPSPIVRVVRGGGWNTDVLSELRGANRDSATPEIRYEGVGFRCARAGI